MNKKALIVSIRGKSLSYKEKLLLSKEKPWGLILFKRNIGSLKQTPNGLYCYVVDAVDAIAVNDTLLYLHPINYFI